ncbi:DUF2460 domain-containing protein [Rhodoblastus acidophilus]|uniref:DUF2460 domain-containing protein n=1 Tax=Candidatus Rhodoblastus alkanivorans TaxID=2954117 RepID=A0ABS9Z906_9HYPH|nr:DUF2460 domain-containing protein [Candidatus Rhodoblastus alkanivorans]MCI4680171.1 DUF2460 domain-containing protein [Candidatus Rhodoblastus alkanivorans]MCI4684128.1 DUF2460 domain-containing protein [Candidatus Rhodoblastus alkanivorans]MDI4641448.1 DUF2460 domain-containing protein [Rhodoblastus acidophilus]
MTTPPTFPALPGQGWSVHKKPVFSTRVASHVSGREVRAGLYAHALYEFELTFNGLDSSGEFAGLQAQSLQILMGFFLTAQGRLNTFLYVDPTDSAATGQFIGTGDGSTTTFTLGRAIGGYFEPVSYVTAIFGVTVNGAPASNYSFTAPNTITFAGAPIAGQAVAWTGTYAFQCRFLDDQMDFEEITSGAWQNKSVKFRSIR